jgi:trehalose 6-phosphate phosphatase
LKKRTKKLLFLGFFSKYDGPAPCGVTDVHPGTLPPPDEVALFLDFDGTLIEIAPRPDAVTVPDDLPDMLHAAERRLGGALALLSGRRISELDALLAPVRLRASGSHGAELRLSPDGPAETAPHLPATLARAIRRRLAEFPGTMLEDKGATLAVHYRAVPAVAARLHAALTYFLATYDVVPVELVRGDKVFEIKPQGIDKGAALRRFMAAAPFAGRRPIFVSDHAIDQAGFDAALALGGAALSVGARLPGIAYGFGAPAEVRCWLRDLAA